MKLVETQIILCGVLNIQMERFGSKDLFNTKRTVACLHDYLPLNREFAGFVAKASSCGAVDIIRDGDGLKKACDLMKRAGIPLEEAENITECYAFVLDQSFTRNTVQKELKPPEKSQDDKHIRFTNADYYGKTANGKANGFGVLYYDDGDVFVGELIDGQPDGRGRLIYSDGDYLEGRRLLDGDNAVLEKSVSQFSDFAQVIYYVFTGDRVSQKKARIFLTDGLLYSGEIIEDCTHHGKAKMFFPDGNYEIGTFEDDEFIGGIMCKSDSDGEVYAGEVHLDSDGIMQREGIGRNEYADGTFVDGIWEDNEFVKGTCRIKYDDGSTYTGQGYFDEDGIFFQDGYGLLESPDGDYNSGTFKEDSFVKGYSKITYENDCYDDGEGYMDGNNFVLHGYGQQRYKSGDIYIGQFKDSFYYGQGTYIYKPGRTVYNTLTGVWKDGKMDGEFTVKYANGDVYVGEFLNDKKNGSGVMTYADGRIEKQTYKNDERI